MIRCVHRATDTSLAFCLTRSGEDHLDNCLHDNNFIKRLINETQRSQILILIVSVNYSNPPDIVNNTVVDKKTPFPVLTLGQLCVLHRVHVSAARAVVFQTLLCFTPIHGWHLTIIRPSYGVYTVDGFIQESLPQTSSLHCHRFLNSWWEKKGLKTRQSFKHLFLRIQTLHPIQTYFLFHSKPLIFGQMTQGQRSFHNNRGG